ncbi:hypothetical protein HII31_11938 [Pseudocercospora fuligena]|uniref:Uncharacterized protein n=1 Tax=Pseudocercospora fuligena TaxID=685502 RepID=A0A8H6R688_9PEZI|nr:hypothetical protein HII31_11938 [Pseudocercospora fuligena]
MGQRHQLFIIAKIGSRYRVLGAVHNQWLYAQFAVRRCRHILELLQTNAAAVRQELQHAAEFDWSAFDKDENKHKLSAFPILASILSVGAAGKERGYSVRIHPLPLSIAPSQCDNNDGFTVFDLSKPDRPRYCFFLQRESEPLHPELPDDEDVVSGESSEEAGRDENVAVTKLKPKPDTALNAAEYLAAYRMSMSDLLDGSSGESLDLWDSKPVIPTAALRSAWPNEPFKILQDDSPHDVALEHLNHQVQSLRENSFAKVLNRAWQSDPNDLSWLDEAQLLPDLHERIINALHDKPDLIFESSGMALFGLATRSHNEIDLSHFRGLTSQMLETLLKQTDPNPERQLHLTLPCMDDLSTEHIVRLLKRHRIDSLHLGYTKGMSEEEAYAVANGQPGLVLTHPGFFREAVAAEKKFDSSMELNPLLDFKPRPRSPLVQVLYAYAGSSSRISHLKDGGVVWSEAIKEVSPYDNHFENTRILPLPIEDAVLPLAELIAILPGALHEMINGRSVLSLIFAPIVAGVAKALTVDRKGHIWPLPAELHASYVQAGRNSHEPLPKAKDIERGSWSLLICVERPPRNCKNQFVDDDSHDHFSTEFEDFRKGKGNRFRYAFVTRDNDEEVVAVDASEFLRQVLARQTPGDRHSLAGDFVQDLVNQIPGKPSATLCSQPEATEVVKAAEIYNGHIDAWIKDMAPHIACIRESDW